MLAKFGSSWLGVWLLVLGALLSSCRSRDEVSTAAESKPGSQPAASEADVIRIGLLAPFSGPFASLGAQIEGGVRAYLDTQGGAIDGRRVELLVRDTTGVPDVAKRLAQGLIVRDQVDFIAGFALTPVAMAVAPLATEAKKPMVIMNAATSSITARSPYVVRVSLTLPQVTAPLATWAAKNGIRNVYSLVSDYAPGADAEAQFRRTFEAAGGTLVASDKVPLNNPDFSPFVQRVKDAKPEAVFVFVPAGTQGIAFMKAAQERGLTAAGIRIIATGDLTEDQQIDAMGDAALGVVTTHHYSAAHASADNDAFKAAFGRVAGSQLRPNFMAVGGYDGMAAIAAVVRRLGPGKIEGDRAMKAFEGLELASPRGPLRIDPETRDVVQTVYVRKVEKRGEDYFNVEFEEYPAQKDPGK